MKRTELERLTYSQIRDMLEDSSNETKVKGYVSENFGITIGSPFKVLSKISGPFRFDEMRWMVVTQGETHPIINLRKYDVHKGDLFFVTGGSIAEIDNTSMDMEAVGMTCTDEMLSLAFDNRLPTILRRPQLVFHTSLTDDERHFLIAIHKLLWQTAHTDDMSPQVLLKLMGSAIAFIDSIYSRHGKAQSDKRSHEERIFDDFLTLVSQYGSTEHKMSFYADKLLLSQRYMGMIIKKVSHVTAKEWIDRQMTATIKVDLRHTDKPLKQIADEMNFPNLSFFNKFFKRMTGMTPMQYKLH